jgi:hypothetical protein
LFLGRLVPPGSDEAFGLDAQAVGDTVDVVKAGDDLHCVVDGAVVKTVGAQSVQVGGGHLVRAVGEPGGKGAQCLVGGGQRSGAPFAGHGVDQGVGLSRVWHHFTDLFPEVVGVSLGSIVAVVLGRDGGGQQLALRTG